MEPCSTEAMWSILEIVVSAFDHLVIIPVAVWCASSVDVNNSVGGGWVHMPLIFTCVWNVCVCVWKVFVINYLFPLVWLPCTLVITFSIWKHFRKHFVWIHSHPRRMTRVSCWYMLHTRTFYVCSRSQKTSQVKIEPLYTGQNSHQSQLTLHLFVRKYS